MSMTHVVNRFSKLYHVCALARATEPERKVRSGDCRGITIMLINNESTSSLATCPWMSRQTVWAFMPSSIQDILYLLQIHSKVQNCGYPSSSPSPAIDPRRRMCAFLRMRAFLLRALIFPVPCQIKFSVSLSQLSSTAMELKADPWPNLGSSLFFMKQTYGCTL